MNLGTLRRRAQGSAHAELGNELTSIKRQVQGLEDTLHGLLGDRPHDQQAAIKGAKLTNALLNDVAYLERLLRDMAKRLRM